MRVPMRDVGVPIWPEEQPEKRTVVAWYRCRPHPTQPSRRARRGKKDRVESRVRAKFQATQVQVTDYGTRVTLQAAYDEENKTWSQWTPHGELQMTITNPAAAEAFKQGEYYFLDFTRAPAKEADEK